MQSEESNTLVKLAKVVIGHAPEGATAFQDIKFSDIEAALSTDAAEKERLRFEGDLDKWMKILGAGITGYQPEAYAVMDAACAELVKLRALSTDAEPLGWQWRHPRATGGEWMHCPNGPRADKLRDTEYRPVYAAPPAPSVAVKVLEWSDDPCAAAKCAFGHYVINENYSLVELLVGYGRASITGIGRIQLDHGATADDLKAAAQSDYEARIRSALSAQVQDVAGWQSMDSAPKDGKHCLLAVKSGPFVYAVQGAYLMGEWGNAADIHSEPLCWMPLTRIPPVYLPWTDEFAAAAPAKQEGGDVTSK